MIGLALEKQDYRIILGQIVVMYPGRVALSVSEVARLLGVDKKIVYAATKRKKNPLPYQKIGTRKVVIPINRLANWLAA